MTNSKLKWGFADKFAATFTAFVFFAFPLWLTFPSSAFISSVGMNVNGHEVEFTRVTPFGSVHARSRSEIVVLDGTEYECHSGAWQWAEYQQRTSNTVSYTIGDWAEPCISRGEDFVISSVRQVYLWGFIPLRPDYTLDTVRVE